MKVPKDLDPDAVEGAARCIFDLTKHLGGDASREFCGLSDEEKAHYFMVASEAILTYYNGGKDLNDTCC